MISTCANMLALASWRTGSAVDLSDLPEKAKIYWSEDKKDWHRLLLKNNSGAITLGGVVESSKKVGDDLADLFLRSEKAPVYRGFLDQAIIDYKLDSAMVMAVAALEIAVKQTIQKVHPETDWLLQEIPSPPVHKMLKDYLPTLESPFVDDNGGIKVSTELLDEVKKAVQARNEIIHKGSIKWPVRRRYKSILMMEWVIRWLEYYQGYSWSPSQARRIAT